MKKLVGICFMLLVAMAVPDVARAASMHTSIKDHGYRGGAQQGVYHQPRNVYPSGRGGYYPRGGRAGYSGYRPYYPVRRPYYNSYWNTPRYYYPSPAYYDPFYAPYYDPYYYNSYYYGAPGLSIFIGN